MSLAAMIAVRVVSRPTPLADLASDVSAGIARKIREISKGFSWFGHEKLHY
jgi:hypothetical protein